ncbi:Uncharacterised protein [Mycobacteroides abscessus subsp. abscessus]|nr:Uncharacterised protein [Mycobacteroides abscessus subsp. abscessus]
MEILGQEARGDHPNSVMHPPFGKKLPHAGINQWVSRFSTLPGPEALAGFGIGQMR